MAIEKLVVGKKYLDRHDNLWVVIHEDKGFTYPFIARKAGAFQDETYTSDGNWSNHTPAGCDLVREASL